MQSTDELKQEWIRYCNDKHKVIDEIMNDLKQETKKILINQDMHASDIKQLIFLFKGNGVKGYGDRLIDIEERLQEMGREVDSYKTIEASIKNIVENANAIGKAKKSIVQWASEFLTIIAAGLIISKMLKVF
jgi:hypothetical protein